MTKIKAPKDRDFSLHKLHDDRETFKSISFFENV